MATGKITKRTLDSLLGSGVSGYLWDEDLEGFGLRTSSTGAASYILQYRMGGRESKTKRYTIGFDGETAIKRSEFGVTALVPAIGDDVKLDIEAECRILE